MAPVKMRVTVTYEYDADPKDYDTDDASAMAEIDEQNFNLPMGQAYVAADLTGLPFKVKVEPV